MNIKQETTRGYHDGVMRDEMVGAVHRRDGPVGAKASEGN